MIGALLITTITFLVISIRIYFAIKEYTKLNKDTMYGTKSQKKLNKAIKEHTKLSSKKPTSAFGLDKIEQVNQVYDYRLNKDGSIAKKRGRKPKA